MPFLLQFTLQIGLPTSSLNFSVPFQALFKQKPDYQFLRIFGCACFPLLRPYNKHKFEFRSQECLFLGYSTAHKGYKCLASNGRLYISKDVVFNELRFPYHELFSATTQSSHSSHSVSAHIPLVPSSSIDPHPPPPSPPIISVDQSPSSSLAPVLSPQITVNDIQGSSSTSVQSSSMSPPILSPPPPLNIHPMITRSKSAAAAPHSVSVLLTHVEPKSYKQALTIPTWHERYAY